jgi:phosphoenolpyruvate synthase/pyruvate phosphate dikinase
MKYEVDPKKYVRVFGGPGMPFITSYMFAKHYRTIDFLITWKDNVWTAFLEKKMLEKTLRDGIKFYSNKENIRRFSKNYENHFKKSISFFEDLVRKKRITKADSIEFFKHAGKTLSLYVKCEFFYLDKAFRESRHNKQLKENLLNFDKFKNPGKEQIIRVYFDANSYIYRFLRVLSKQFKISFEDLVAYRPEEILDLFNKKKVSKEELAKRKKFYILMDRNMRVNILYDNSYKKIIDFMVPKIEPKTVLRGTIANKGIYAGKVKLFNHGYEFYKVDRLIQEMDKGDILVTETTSPELVVACKKAGAIVTNEGGLLSHAAIISRELKIPCIVGAHGITSSVKDGDIIEVDANKGIVRKIK